MPAMLVTLSLSVSFSYCDVIMGEIASQITSLTIVYSTVYSDADQRKHQSSASLAFVRVPGEFPAQMASNAENGSRETRVVGSNFIIRTYVWRLLYHKQVSRAKISNYIPQYSVPYPEPVVFQWQSSGNPVCLEHRPQCTLECHWGKNCW